MPGPLRFTPIFMDRVWGGDKLASYLHEPVPPDRGIGEAWLMADHTSAETVVAEGPYQGRTLQELLAEHADAILGRRATLTPHGRFPLLLKILDAGSALSVQVHPDDACALRLSEPDVGKTEMWHVIQADAGSELVCGLDPAMDANGFRTAVERDCIEAAMTRFKTAPGDSVFVSAGTVHAIGGGILLAEIQQNSDLTYRIYDYNRPGADGMLRELHAEKAAEAIHFGSSHAGKNEALPLPAEDGVVRSVLAVCRYFAAERWELGGRSTHETHGDSFHIVLMIDGAAQVVTNDGAVSLATGQAGLVPANTGRYSVEGDGTALVYFVPNLARDIVKPLVAAGHPMEAIIRLGGDPATSDLALAGE